MVYCLYGVESVSPADITSLEAATKYTAEETAAEAASRKKETLSYLILSLPTVATTSTLRKRLDGAVPRGLVLLQSTLSAATRTRGRRSCQATYHCAQSLFGTHSFHIRLFVVGRKRSLVAAAAAPWIVTGGNNRWTLYQSQHGPVAPKNHHFHHHNNIIYYHANTIRGRVRHYLPSNTHPGRFRFYFAIGMDRRRRHDQQSVYP